MKVLIATAACLLAGAAWAQSKPQSVVVTNPSLTVRDANAGLYTHVGQKPGRVVNLIMSGTFSAFNYFARRIDPAFGTDDGTPFTVPDGFWFVLTDIQGLVVQCTSGASLTYTLGQETHTNGDLEAQRNHIALICPGTGKVSFERHFSTGLVFGPGSKINLYVFGTDVPTVSYAQGYLVPTD